MDNVKRIEELLNMYLKQNKDIRDKYQNNLVYLQLYEELFSYLELGYVEIKENSLLISILFNTIYGNNIYGDRFYSLLLKAMVSKEGRIELKHFINMIKKDYDNLMMENDGLVQQIERNKNVVSSANRVKLCFKYGNIISGDLPDVSNVKRIISLFQLSGVISNKEELLLINEIELYNKRISLDKLKDNDREYTIDLYERIPNILNAGFQEHDKISVSENKKNTLDRFANEIEKYLLYLNTDEIIPVIEEYKRYNIDNNEYNYLIVRVLDDYLNDLLTYYEYLMDKDVYTKRQERIEVVKNYYQVLDKYLYLRNYYEKINEIDLVLVDNDNNDELYCNDSNDKQLIFAHSNVNISKSRIISDMGSVPHEYYERVYELINGFKKNTLRRKEVASFTSVDRSMASFFELRDDQIRIIVKHMDSDIYCIMGVFVKKSDNLRSVYRSMVSRELPNISTDDQKQMYIELGKKDMEELEQFVSNNKRKGTR